MVHSIESVSEIGNIWLESYFTKFEEINYPRSQSLEMKSIIKKWPMSACLLLHTNNSIFSDTKNELSA